MDIVFIQGLKIPTIIGIYDWERKTKQVVRLDLEMAADIRPAAKTDKIHQALDYKAVAKRLIEFVGQSKFELVETLAEEIARVVLEEFDIGRVRLRLDKGEALTGADGVGVVIERSR